MAPVAATPPTVALLKERNNTSFLRLWISIFVVATGLFVLRFLVPSPVGMADNGDGPRLLCGLGIAPVTGSYPRYVDYAYFSYTPSASCASEGVYPSSQHLLLVAAQWLTPVLGLVGKVNLIALGLITCVLAAAGIASLAAGLRISVRGRLAVAAVLWLVMADAAFFDTYASPFSEGATLVGLLLVTAGVVYLGRGKAAAACGIVLAGAGGYLTVLSKEQYLPLAAPVCLTLILASAARNGRWRARHLISARWPAAVLVAGILAALAVSSAHQDGSSRFNALLNQEQAVDVIFDSIVNGHDNAVADLHALGLPASWAKYAGHGFWATPSVYQDPLYARYASRLNDVNIAHFLITHPLRLPEIGQQAADDALQLRVSYLGSYAPSAGHQPGAIENRVDVLSRLVESIPSGFGLLWLCPLWITMLAIARSALRRRETGPSWRADAAMAVLCMVGCAMAAFVPAAYFAGAETTRHMLGMNMATALAFPLSVALLGSLLTEGLPAASAGLAGPAGQPADLAGPVGQGASLPGQYVSEPGRRAHRAGQTRRRARSPGSPRRLARARQQALTVVPAQRQRHGHAGRR